MRSRASVLVLAAALLLPSCAPAEARVVSGRTPAERERGRLGEDTSRWSLDLGAGLAAGGDLFQVAAAQTVAWPTPRGGSFQARRYDVTLDEDVLLAGGLCWRTGTRSSLRLSLAWTEMDLTALANDSQFVAPVPWDRARFLRAGLVWEQRLTETRLRPYGLIGVGYSSLAAGNGALDQGGITPLLGAGALLRLAPRVDLRLEVVDGIRQFESEALVGDLLPAGTDLRERGPQHLVALTAGLRLAF